MADKVDDILAEYANWASPSLEIDVATITQGLKRRKKDIVNFLNFYSYPDGSSDEHKVLIDIYNKYQKEVNELLAQLEVNIHDLDKEVLDIITDLNRSVVLLRRPEANDNHIRTANNIMYILIHVLKIKLIESYIKRIKQYRKFLRSFNQKGIKITDKSEKEISFYDYTKKEFRYIKKCYKHWKKSHKCYYNLGNGIDEYFGTKEEVGLTPIFDDTKALANLYEQYYSEIIGNGYGASIVVKIINTLLVVVPTSLLILSIYLHFRG